LGYFRSNISQQFRQGFGLSNDREEIAIVAPSWDNVLMQMPSDASSSNCTLVHAYVEPVCTASNTQNTHGLLG
jgi:hypothetical protein